MKRILSLFITALILFSVIPTVAFASSDYEAELLSALSIMQGDPNGNMRYLDKVSRAECAKIIVAASKYRNSVDLNSKRSSFKDVTFEHWAAPYISTGIKNGLFKGYFDATFRPSNTVLFEEAVTMLLRILDYTDEDLGGNWPYDQINTAREIGILDEVNKSIGQELTRRDISKMVYNTLNSSSKGTQNTYLSNFNRIIGPKTVLSANWYEDFGATSSIRVMRDGVKSSVFEARINDIAYYMEEYKTALLYSKKVTGIYESATPNKDNPISITVSGITYNIEGDAAYSKLSSGGSLKFGDTVTLLLGKSGDVADVTDNKTTSTNVSGFLSSVGTKETSSSGTTLNKPYIRVVLPSGEVCEYITEKNYESYLNRAVTVKLENGLATISSIIDKYNVSGKITWDSEIRSIGTHTLSSDVEIIEVSTTDPYETATISSVYPQRLNGLKLSDGDILYMSKNSVGNIDELIIKDITGDTHTYGIVTYAKNENNDRQVSGSYEYIVNGTKSSLNTQNKSFGVSSGQAVKIKGNGKEVTSMTPLTLIKSTKITEIDASSITMGSTSYIMSDKVQIYTKSTSSSVYNMITIDELKEIASEHRAYVYTDKLASSGGRVRVIILHTN